MIKGLLTVGSFLVGLIFNLIIFVLWIRIFLRYFRVSTLHPAGQAIFGITNPLISPVERLFFHKRMPRYDGICLAFIILVELIKFLLLGLLIYRTVLPISYLLLFVGADLIVQPCNLLFYALLIRIILSWMNPQRTSHPAIEILNKITNPIIALGRKVIPDISGFDFAPYIMLVILKVITLFINASMPLHLF